MDVQKQQLTPESLVHIGVKTVEEAAKKGTLDVKMEEIREMLGLEPEDKLEPLEVHRLDGIMPTGDYIQGFADEYGNPDWLTNQCNTLGNESDALNRAIALGLMHRMRFQGSRKEGDKDNDRFDEEINVFAGALTEYLRGLLAANCKRYFKNEIERFDAVISAIEDGKTEPKKALAALIFELANYDDFISLLNVIDLPGFTIPQLKPSLTRESIQQAKDECDKALDSKSAVLEKFLDENPSEEDSDVKARLKASASQYPDTWFARVIDKL